MSIGTTPLTIQVPAREPIRKRIRMAGMAVPIPLTTLARIDNHLYPRLTEITPATAEARIRAIWFAPERVSS
ncbi:MAG: hypothetical protein BWY89_01061 [Bacteroidetes bacterium ADurb.BinA012]|nr:MAG: hypothetical protein BWY89_01061 [Bacteroidetes bacterium ADurb.BinA012]